MRANLTPEFHYSLSINTCDLTVCHMYTLMFPNHQGLNNTMTLMPFHFSSDFGKQVFLPS